MAFCIKCGANVKKMISVFAMLFVAASMLFALDESEKRQVLSLFKSYKQESSTKMTTYIVEYYTVYDYNNKKLQLCFIYDRFKFLGGGKNDQISLSLGAYNTSLGPILGNTVQEFVREFNNNRYVGKKSSDNSRISPVAPPSASSKSQYAQSSSNSARPSQQTQVSGTTGRMIDVDGIGFHDLSRVTKVIDCVNDMDWKNIRDGDTILVRNLTITWLSNIADGTVHNSSCMAIHLADRHGHDLQRDVFAKEKYTRFFIYQQGDYHTEFITKLRRCYEGVWDKRSQSYVDKKTVSAYVQVHRGESDDELEIIAITLPI